MGTTSPQVGVRIPPVDEKKIDELIKKGQFINRSDFLRRAIAEKLEKMEKG